MLSVAPSSSCGARPSLRVLLFVAGSSTNKNPIKYATAECGGRSSCTALILPRQRCCRCIANVTTSVRICICCVSRIPRPCSTQSCTFIFNAPNASCPTYLNLFTILFTKSASPDSRRRFGGAFCPPHASQARQVHYADVVLVA